jgi:DNA repair photolyase
MIMIVREVLAKTILSKSKVFDYSVNPYIGCEHGCTYCYARFIKRYTGHKEQWGEFVDAKINAAALLKLETEKKTRGTIWLSGTCDPYQPVEKKYELTKGCLEVISERGWAVIVQTKSPLVIRDLELLSRIDCVDVGFSISTADESIREVFEPNSPPINERIQTLEKLHSAGIRTFAMIAPLLPNAENLAEELRSKVDYVLIDKMNYHYADWVYKKSKLEYAMNNTFFDSRKEELTAAFKKEKIPTQLLF